MHAATINVRFEPHVVFAGYDHRSSGYVLDFDTLSDSPPRALAVEHERISSARFLNDGRRVLVGTCGGKLFVFGDDGHPRELRYRHASQVEALAVDPDDRSVASSGQDGLVIFQRLPAR